MSGGRVLARRRGASGGEWSAGRLALAMNLPSILLILGVIGYPIVYTVNVAFREAGVRGFVTGQMPWVGLKNFATVLADSVFLTTFIQTFIFVALSVLFEVALGLGIALVINMRHAHIASATKVLLLLPWAVPPIVNGVMWSYVFNSNYGALNAALFQIGLIDEPVQWVSDPKLALVAIVAAYVWRTVPFGALLFHAALGTIPESLYEASEIDGAGPWQRWRYVTWPLLKPTVAIVLILRTIFAFMVFDEIFAITGGGPGDSTWTAAWYIYSFAFRFFKFGPAAAAAIVLTAVIATVSALYVRLLYRQVEY